MSKRAPIICIVIGIGFVVTPALWRLANRRVPNPTQQYETRWRVPVPSLVDSLDPKTAQSETERNYLLLLYGRLVRQNSALELEADTLESWSYNIQSRTYVFKLRPDVVFHDGKALTSADVVFSFHEWAKKSAPDHELLAPIVGAREYTDGRAQRISGIQPLSPLEFHVRLEDWVDNFIPRLARPGFVIYPQDMGGQTHETFFLRPNATGPYKVASFQPGRLEVESHDKYYRGPPQTPIIEVYHQPLEQARADFASGRVNNLLLYDISNPHAFSAEGVRVVPQPRQTTHALVFNDTHPALKNRGFRRRIAEALAKEDFLPCLPGARIANRLIPAESELVKTSAPEPARAHKKSLSFSFSATENETCLRPILQKHLDKLGVRLSAPPPSPAANPDLLIQGFNFYKDDLSQNIKYLLAGSPSYLLGSSIPRLQALLSDITPGMSTRDVLRAHDRLDEFLITDYRVVPLAHSNHFSVYREELQNAELLKSPRFVANWQDVRVLKEPDAD